MKYKYKQLKEPYVLDSKIVKRELDYIGPDEVTIFLTEGGTLSYEETDRTFTLKSSNPNHILYMDMLQGCPTFLYSEHLDTEEFIELIPNLLKRRTNTIHSPVKMYDIDACKIVDGVVNYVFRQSEITVQDVIETAKYELPFFENQILLRPTEEEREPYRRGLAICEWVIKNYNEEVAKTKPPHNFVIPNLDTIFNDNYYKFD